MAPIMLLTHHAFMLVKQKMPKKRTKQFAQLVKVSKLRVN